MRAEEVNAINRLNAAEAGLRGHGSEEERSRRNQAVRDAIAQLDAARQAIMQHLAVCPNRD